MRVVERRSVQRSIPIAHVDDPRSTDEVLACLRAIHGPNYGFAIRRWEGETPLAAPDGRVAYLFVIDSAGASTALLQGDLVRGPAPTGPYRSIDEAFAEVTANHHAEVWPGDVLTTAGSTADRILLTGRGVCLEVVAEATPYPAPRLGMLRHLPDHPRGCSSYEGAFRRETLPPDQSGTPDDERGANRVNEHTLDMRCDRSPLPIPHAHRPVTCGAGRSENNTETAIILRRAVYGLPNIGPHEDQHMIMFRRPTEDPPDPVRVPLRAGSIVVTPATDRWVMGHYFENAFAMLVAIPRFAAPPVGIAGQPPLHGYRFGVDPVTAATTGTT